MKNRLDSTAIVHCALMNSGWINAYRITATMTEKVDPDALQQAMDSMIERYPTICSRIVKGFSWYHTETMESIKVKPLDCGLLGSINHKDIYRQAINIMYDENRIILEAFHSVTDGHGAFTFLNSLLGTYGALLDGSLRPNTAKGSFVDEELEDGFLKYGNTTPNKGIFAPVENPFFFEKQAKNKKIDATVFKMKSSRIRQMAKENRCSMNDLLVAAMFKAVFRMPEAEGKSVALTVPVNLRRFFDTPSLLNFSYLSTAAINRKEKHLSLRETAALIKSQLKEQNNEEYLRKAVSKIASISKNALMRNTPLFVKNFAIRFAMLLGIEKTCMTVTNLGNVAAMLPDAEGHVRCVDVLLSPRRTSPYNCGIVSYNDEMHIILTHSLKEKALVKYLAKHMAELGIVFNMEKYTV
jgi:NRPS condensation-like uncharacterized protein